MYCGFASFVGLAAAAIAVPVVIGCSSQQTQMGATGPKAIQTLCESLVIGEPLTEFAVAGVVQSVPKSGEVVVLVDPATSKGSEGVSGCGCVLATEAGVLRSKKFSCSK